MTTIKTASEQAAHVANEIHQAADSLRGYLAELAKFTEQQQNLMANNMMVDVSWLVSPTAKAVEAQTKLQTLVNVSHLVGVTQDQLQAAYAADAVWFTS